MEADTPQPPKRCTFASCSEPATHFFQVDGKTICVCAEHAKMLKGPEIVIRPMSSVFPPTSTEAPT